MKAKTAKCISVGAMLVAAALLPAGCTALSKHESKPRKTAEMPYAHPKYPGLQPQKKESKSWFSSWFKPKEPEEPKTVGQWMKENKRPEF